MAAGVEKQAYRVIYTLKGFQVRYYPAAILASFYSQGSSYREIATPGFRMLAGFIFGNNASGTRIAMTSPVHMDINEKGSSMSFVMPSAYRAVDLPVPNNSRVVLEEADSEHVASLRFGGYASDHKIRRYSEKLGALLQESGISYQGNFRYLGYDPPYRFIGRRNEIIVSIEWAEGSGP